MRLGRLLLASALLQPALACAPSLQSVSSGQVGCAPDEIEISDVAHEPGFTTAASTWTATCEGRVFYCSQLSSAASYGSGDGYAFGTNSTETKCTPAGGTVAAAPAAQPRPAKKQFTDSPLPTQAVGFTFGVDPIAAQSACETAGHTWSVSSSSYACSGTPQNVGMKTSSTLNFCQDKLCDLTIFAEFSNGSTGEKQFMDLWEALRKQYGKPGVDQTTKGGDCDGQFVECVARSRANWQAQWQWEAGPRIVAKTVTRSDRAHLAVRYILGEADRLEEPKNGEVDGNAF